jgi:hypothetical protein
MDYQFHRLPSWYNYQRTLHSVLTHTENAVENKRIFLDIRAAFDKTSSEATVIAAE